MKRGGLLALTLSLLSLAGLVLYLVWPKYGLCLVSSRYDEIACLARRNLHFSAHFSWSFNAVTFRAVMAEVGPADIPVLTAMLGDERRVLAALAGQVLAQLGETGLASLREAARSTDPDVSWTAKSALMDHEIMRSNR